MSTVADLQNALIGSPVKKTVDGKYRVKDDGSVQLWNADQSAWQEITVSGSAANEQINTVAGEA